MGRTTRSTANPSQSHRLPVNPRRHKVKQENRKRVATACNSCNVRRVKCSGQQPCNHCANAQPPRECQYPTSVEKVTIPLAELEELKARCAALQSKVDTYAPISHGRPDGTSSSPGFQFGSSPSDSEDEVDSPGSGQGVGILLDSHGNVPYPGETREAAPFLDHLNDFIVALFPLAFQTPYSGPGEHTDAAFPVSHMGQYNTTTFDSSRPLFETDFPLDVRVNPVELPPRAEMTARLIELRYFLQDGNGGYPSGGIWYWGNICTTPFFSEDNSINTPDNLTGLGTVGGAWSKHRHLSLYQTALAVSHELGAAAHSQQQASPNLGKEDRTPLSGSLPFFLRARTLLGNPLDVTAFSVSDVSVLSLMAIYLLELNRFDAAYMYVSVAIHLCIVHGAHRGWVVNEQGKRAFWTAFILDRHMSCLMGRPPAISNDAVTLDLPADIIGLPPATGLRAHVELSRISARIVCKTYRFSPVDYCSQSRTASRMERALNMLQDWLNILPPVLRLDNDRPTQCHDRGCIDLHMSYNHLVIFAIRPAFFLAIQKIINERYPSIVPPASVGHHAHQIPLNTQTQYSSTTLENHPHAHYFQRLLTAARTNLLLTRHLSTLSPTQKLLQPELDHAFNSTIILLLNQLITDPTIPSPDRTTVHFTLGLFDREAQTQTPHSLGQAKLVRNLDNIVQRIHTIPSQTGTTPTPCTSSLSLMAPAQHLELITTAASPSVSPLLSIPPTTTATTTTPATSLTPMMTSHSPSSTSIPLVPSTAAAMDATASAAAAVAYVHAWTPSGGAPVGVGAGAGTAGQTGGSGSVGEEAVATMPVENVGGGGRNNMPPHRPSLPSQTFEHMGGDWMGHAEMQHHHLPHHGQHDPTQPYMNYEM